MTLFHVASIGSYPRTGEEKDHQRYPRALGHFERKEISAHALRDVEQSIVQEVIREQIDHGCDEVTDGLVAWKDPVTRFCRNLSGVKTGGLTRYFDNNFYIRTPEIAAKPKIAPVSASDYAFAKGCSNRPVRAVVTGPLTLALHARSAIKPYDKIAGRVALFTDVIVQEVAALAAAGAPVIQVDEPSLLTATPEDRKLALAAFGKIVAAKGNSLIALAVMFGAAAPSIDLLLGFPTDILQIDLSLRGSDAVERLAAAPKRPTLGLGAANARSTRLETVNEMKFLIEPLLKSSPEKIYLTPSCGLEFLPRPTAIAKIRLLADLRAGLGNGAVHG